MHLIKLVDLKESCHIFWSLHHSHIQKYFYNLISYILLEFFYYNISSCFSGYYVCKTGRKIKIRDAQVTKTKMEARMFWPWAANPDLLFNMSRVFLLQQSTHTHTHTHTHSEWMACSQSWPSEWTQYPARGHMICRAWGPSLAVPPWLKSFTILLHCKKKKSWANLKF